MSVRKKVSNRLLLLLGVKSPRIKNPFLTFFIFTPLVSHIKHVFMFQNFPWRSFALFSGEFCDNLRFLAFFAKCLMQKCEYVVPAQCIFTWQTMQ